MKRLCCSMLCPRRHSRRRRGGSGSKRRKLSKIRANGLFIWANSLDIWAHHCQNAVSVSAKTFFFWRTPSLGQKNRSNFRKKPFFFFSENTFIWTEKPFKFQERPFFFLENTSIWAEKTASILTEKRNASSHFSGKSLLPPQIILSSYGHATRDSLLATIITKYCAVAFNLTLHGLFDQRI